MTRKDALEAQGARCGHIDGKARNSVYVMGEEYMVDLAMNYESPADQTAFERGYYAGYRVGADGEELDPETVNAPLPEECE